MAHPLFHVRGARPEDANELLDIDIKCYEDAWTAEEWSRVGHNSEFAISVVTYYGGPIGFAVFRQAPDSGDAEIVKIAVKKPYRLKGASCLLVAAGIRYAKDHCNTHLFLVVPESSLDPNAPNNTGKWLKAIGFKAVLPFLRNHFAAYGEYEDGVKFSAPVNP